MIGWKAGAGAILLGTGALLAGCGAGADDPEQDRGVSAAEAEGGQLATARFSVEGMTCGGCVVATEVAVRRVDGVRSVTAHYDGNEGEGRAEVEYDQAVTDVEAIATAIRKAGFTPRLEEAGEGVGRE